MIDWAFSLVTSFVLLGLVEAVIKPAAAYWVRQKIIRWTPRGLGVRRQGIS